MIWTYCFLDRQEGETLDAMCHGDVRQPGASSLERNMERSDVNEEEYVPNLPLP